MALAVVFTVNAISFLSLYLRYLLHDDMYQKTAVRSHPHTDQPLLLPLPLPQTGFHKAWNIRLAD